MNIVAIHTEPGPVGWLRCWNWTTQLSYIGHNVRQKPDKGEQFDWADIDNYLRDADVVITCRMANAKIFAALLAGRDLYHYKLVVDTDDNSDVLPEFNYAYPDYHSGSGVARIARGELKAADLVTVSTDYLGKWAKKYSPNVVTVPNCVNPRLYEGVKSRNKEPRHANDIRIYWGGGGGHYDDLLTIKEPVLRVFHENPNVKLVFSNILPDWAARLPASRVFFLRFAKFQAYPKLLRWLCADVAIAPLVDNEFNRCKSNIKYLDYAMAGIPAVYQNLEPYKSVADGVTGLKASTADEWYVALNRLISDRELNRSISAAAREDVLATWNIDGHIKRYESMLEELVNGVPRIPMQYLSEGVSLNA